MLTISAILFAPRYLAYADPPRQSDAVILFPAGEKGAREREACQLVRDGFAEYLIIPACGQVQKLGPDGKLMAFNWKRPADVSNQSNQLNKPNQWNRFFENTHTEVLVARQMMERSGFRTAILVSSPYHMRRIKIIADQVFFQNPPAAKGATQSNPPLSKGGRGDLDTSNSFYQLSFVPTRYDSAPGCLWFINGPELHRVLSEYVKIVWFKIYSSFTATQTDELTNRSSMLNLKRKT